MSEDRREAERHDLSRIGWISLSDRLGALDCIVRDVSATGALLVLKSTAVVPNTFRLDIQGAGREHRCEVRRRTKQTLGVRFTT